MSEIRAKVVGVTLGEGAAKVDFEFIDCVYVPAVPASAPTFESGGEPPESEVFEYEKLALKSDPLTTDLKDCISPGILEALENKAIEAIRGY